MLGLIVTAVGDSRARAVGGLGRIMGAVAVVSMAGRTVLVMALVSTGCVARMVRMVCGSGLFC